MQTLAVYKDNELSAAGFLLFRVGGKDGELDFMLDSLTQSFESSLQTLGVKVCYMANFFPVLWAGGLTAQQLILLLKFNFN